MLVTILISATFVCGVIFGWVCSTELKKRSERLKRLTILEQSTTASLKDNLKMLNEELAKRGTNKESPYR